MLPLSYLLPPLSGSAHFSCAAEWKGREKAVHEEGGCKVSRKKSNFCLVLCAFQNGNATLIKVPIKPTMQGSMMGFRRLGRRRRGRSERGNKIRALFLKETAKCSTREKKCLHTLHGRVREYIISYWQLAIMSLLKPQKDLLVPNKTVENRGNGVTSTQ